MIVLGGKLGLPAVQNRGFLQCFVMLVFDRDVPDLALTAAWVYVIIVSIAKHERSFSIIGLNRENRGFKTANFRQKMRFFGSYRGAHVANQLESLKCCPRGQTRVSELLAPLKKLLVISD